MPILQAGEGASVDSFVVFLAILLLIFPVLFIRNLLKGWRPGSTGGLFWKALLIFSAPFYFGVIIIKFFSIAGLVSDDFSQLFPSLQKPAGTLPDVSGIDINFWSEFTVGLMAAALISGLSAILIYSIFKKRQSSKKKLGGLVFWAALYASAIIIANGAFDLIQESALESQAKKTQQQRQTLEDKKKARENAADDLSRKIFLLGSAEGLSEEATEQSLDETFRQNKLDVELEMGDLAEDAPDSVLDQYFLLTNKRAQNFALQDPLACHYFFQAGTYLRRFKDLFQDTNNTPEMAALLEALAREVANPSSKKVSPKMDAPEFAATTQDLYESVRTTIPKEDQNFDVFDNPQRLVSERAKTQGCYTYQAYVNEISNLPSDDAVRYYRALLEDRADALNAEAALVGNQGLLTIYQDLVPEGSPLDILFEDNPNLKKDFVLLLIENSGLDPAETRALAAERKKGLLDTNIRYYFALASDVAIFGHISYHATFLQQLSEDGAGLCGRMAGILEEADVSLFGASIFKRHGNSLATVMKSSRAGGNKTPTKMADNVFDETLERIESDMRRSLGGARLNLDLLLNPEQRLTDQARAQACRQAEAFYSALGRRGQAQAAAFYRTLLLDEPL